MTKAELKTIEWAIEVLELYQENDPNTPLKVLGELKGLYNKHCKLPVIIKQETQVQQFVRVFGEVYQECTGQVYKIDKKHFIMVHKLIKDYGLEAVSDKSQLLAFYCREARVWFVKDGWSSFTIETLSNRWNNLLPQRRLTPEEAKDQKYRDEVKKWEEHDAAINSAIERSRAGTGGTGTGTPSRSTG